MARIAGVDLPPQKRLWVGLTSIYGIGQERAKKLAEKAGVDHTKKIRDLTEDEINHLRQESARKNSRRSASAASFRTVWCTLPRRSTTRRSPSRTRMAASCAGPLRARSASRDRARVRRTPRSRLPWLPRAWRATST